MSYLVPWSIQTHKSLNSTQDTLKELIAVGDAVEGTLIRALKQTGGYGRHGRKWEEAPGNLSFSFLLQPKTSLAQSTTLSLITGIALTRTIQGLLEVTDNEEVILKWPNDVMLKGHKCAGILLENIEQNIVIGIGINISSAPIEGSVCLSDYKENVTITPEKLLKRFLEVFKDIYGLWLEQGFTAFRSDFIKLSYKIDTPVCVKLPRNTIEGLFQGVDKDGSLLILCKDTQKLQKITTGDVFLV